MSDEALAAIRKTIEDRVSEQMTRHVRLNPNADPKQVIDIQMKQEQERLRLAIQNAEDQILMDVYRALLEWLPELANSLKSRYR